MTATARTSSRKPRPTPDVKWMGEASPLSRVRARLRGQFALSGAKGIRQLRYSGSDSSTLRVKSGPVLWRAGLAPHFLNTAFINFAGALQEKDGFFLEDRRVGFEHDRFLFGNGPDVDA